MLPRMGRGVEPLEVPPGIAALGEDVVTEVRALVAEAERAQDAETAAALRVALRIVPWPLRAIVRGVLLG